MGVTRDEAWRRLHDPATDATALAEIARAHPEFADAIRRHPNSYAELRAWADAVAGSVDAPATPAISATPATLATPAAPVTPAIPAIPAGVSAPAEAPTPEARLGASPPGATPAADATTARRRIRRPAVVGAVLGGALLVGGVVAATAVLATRDASSPAAEELSAAPTEVPSASPAETVAGERRLDAPPVYVGDELSLFLLDAQQLARFVPDAADGRVSDRLLTIGEGEGVRTDPASCVGWIIPDEMTVTGARALQWSEQGYTSDSMTVRQFPTPELAAAWAEPFLGGTCDSFSFGQSDPLTTTIDATVVADVDDRVLARRVQRDDGFPARTVVVGRESNVVVVIDTDVDLADTAASDLATLVNDTILSARAAVTAKIGYR